MEKVKDTIYRQDAINAMWKIRRQLQMLDDTHKADRIMHGIYLANKALKQLPPAQPERKTGKWNFIGNQMFECSECGTCYTQSQFYQMRVRISDTEFPKFCPNCGADMREEQDEQRK